ncbi:MAG: bifunctional DNA-binding transcriptional regulator/O6-methylguanine-DNA methyltransferase Ada [Alphaproteobacteria bacterium]|nr:bifunctional DNA-binding transcriptional regulator/O6-methylguanine-DNA methyltransferase Ada [Alphaproteobacteria bacterium]
MNAIHPPIAERRWRAVVERRADPSFVLGVITTGIYCRAGCPARQPKRENVRFFDGSAQAELAGFRACKRCRPQAAMPLDPALPAIRRALAALDRAETPPRLARLALVAGQSPAHFQRCFTRLVGVSPRAYWDARRLKGFKTRLRSGGDVTGALYESGYGSPSRVYEEVGMKLGMTPGAYAKGGQGQELGFAVAPCPLGLVLVATSARGVAFVALGDDAAGLEAELRRDFPRAAIAADRKRLGETVAQVVSYLEGRTPSLDLPIDVRATAFQRQVWDALRRIPSGETRSYAAVARSIGRPRAVRAVARACATNPVSLVVPCHRVVGSDGKLTGYRWGIERKRALLATERAQAR